MWISKYFIDFIIISFLGWAWETIYNIGHERKWIRRGFLYGPICPIYGVGALLGITLIKCFQISFGYTLVWWHIALASFLGSTILEYITGWVLEKIFHAYWWDYSDLRFHYKGRICLSASCAFALAGLLIVYFLMPVCDAITTWLPGTAIDLIFILFLVIFVMDMTLTISTLTEFEKMITDMDDGFNERMADVVDNIFRTSNKYYRKTISRVKGFRYPKISQEKIQKLFDSMRSDKQSESQ